MIESAKSGHILHARVSCRIFSTRFVIVRVRSRDAPSGKRTAVKNTP